MIGYAVEGVYYAVGFDLVPDFDRTIWQRDFELYSFVDGLIEEIAAVTSLPSDPFHLGWIQRYGQYHYSTVVP
jgi:hypothetical protein